MPLPVPAPTLRVTTPPPLPKDALTTSTNTSAAPSPAATPTAAARPTFALPTTKALNVNLPTSPHTATLSPSTPMTPLSASLNPGSARPLPASFGSSSRFGTLKTTKQSVSTDSDVSLLSDFTELRTLSANPKAARKLARNRATIGTLLEAIRAKPNFVKMVEYSLECLRNLAVDAGSVEEMCDEGVVDVVQTVLKLNPYNERIQAVANALLSSFCVNDALAASVGAKMGAAPILHSMRKHVEAGTIASTCHTASRLMRSDDNLHLLVKGGLLPALHHVYGTQEESVAVVEAANECVALVAQQSYHSQQLLDSHVAEDVLASLKHYPENERLVSAGLSAFHAMLTVQGSVGASGALSPRNAKATKDAIACMPAAVDTLMTAIEAHPDNDALLDKGAEVLRALSDGNEMGVLLCVDPGNNSATASAVSKVSSLLLVESNVDACVKAGGVGCVMRAINAASTAAADGDANVHTSAILTSGARALQRLCVDEQKIYALMQAGAVKALVGILDKHKSEADVAVSAVKALTAMSTREENALYIAKSGGVRLTEAVRAAHPVSDAVAARIMELQSKMAGFARVAPLQVKDGVVRGIVDLFNSRSQQAAKDDVGRRAVLGAINTLSKLVRQGDECAKAVVAGDVMSGVSGVLKANRGDEEIVKRGLEFFGQCAELSRGSGAGAVQQSAAMRAKEKGVMESVLAVMDAMKENADIQQLCSQLLPALSDADKGDESSSITSALKDTDAAISGGEQKLDSLLTNVQHVSQLSMLDSNAEALIEQGAVRRLVEAFETAARANGESAGAGVRVGVMSGAAHAVHRLMKERQVEVCGAMMSGGMAHALVQSAVLEQSESVSASVTPLIAVLAADAGNADGLMKDGTVQGMLTLAKAHHLNEQIVHDATRTIGLVVAHEEGNIARVVEWGSAEVLIDSLLTHHADLRRTHETLQVINTVTAQQASVPSFLSMDSISAIVEIMKVYASQPDILTLSMQCLAHFLINEDAAQEVCQLNGCALLVKAMRDHYASEELCEIDMLLLHSLSSLQANVDALLDAELATVELVKWVANKYAKNTLLVDAGHKLLTALDVKKGEAALDLTSSFDGAQADLILSRLRNPNVSQQDMLSLLSSLSGLVNTTEKADILAARGGVALLAGCVNRSVKNEPLFFGSAAALLRVCDHLGEGSLGELARAEVLQALAAVINSGQLGFGTAVSAGDLTSAVRAMGRLKMREEVVKAILAHNPLNRLMSVLYNSDDQDLLPATARLVSKLTNNDEAAACVSRITNLRELIQAMRRQAQERGAQAEDFLKYGVYLLGNLAANDERVKDEIGIEGGIQVVLFIVNIPLLRAKAPFVEYCTLALANLSLNSTNNQAFIVASRGVPLLLELITQHNRAVDLLENAVCVLCNVCYRNDSNKDAILQLGGAKILVATALANFSAVPVLMAAFRTLGNLAYSPPSTSAIIGAGAVQALVAGMSIHGSNTELCLLCLRVLTNLCSDYVEGNMSTMREEGAVQAVVEVCRTHAASTQPADMELVNAALLCLCNLGRFYANAQLIILQSITAELVLVIHTHGGDATLLLATARLFNILCHTHPAELDRLLDSGIAPAVKEALECRGGQSKAVFGHLCAGLTLLSYNSEIAVELGGAGVVQALLSVLTRHSNDASYFVDAFPALSSLCRDEASASSMAPHAFGYLGTALSSPALDHKLLLHSFAFLSNLCMHASAAQSIVQTRVLSLIFTALHSHADLPDILVRGLRAVENLCYTGDAVKSYLTANQLEREVLRVMSDNMRHEDVKRACQAILDAYHTHQSTFELAPLDAPSAPFQDIEIKSARQLFGDEQKEQSDLFPDHIRNFLNSGQLLTKHSKTAPPRPRHVYVTADLKWLVWKDPKKPLHPDNKMKTWKLRGVEKGRCTQQLLRKRFGKYLCREEGGFAIIGRDRNVDLECESEKDREKWVQAIAAFVAWLKFMKKNASQFDKEDARDI